MKRLLVAALFALASTMAFAQSLPTPNVAGLKVNGTAQTFPASGSIAGTSDTQTLTNKTISGASNTLSNIPESALNAIAADSVLGNASASSAAPGVVNLTSCSTTSSALTYSTSSHAFGCNTIVGTSASYTTVAALVAANVPASVQTITTAGYYAAGDGGGTTYVRVASAPANSCSQQSADGAFWAPQFISPFNAQVCGAYGDGSHIDGAAINAAFTDCNAYGGGIVQLPQTAVGIYLTNSQINTGSCILNGTGGGKIATSANAVILRAGSSFPTNTALVRTFDATRGGATNLVIDCNSVSGCSEIQYDSDNNPISTHGIFEHLTLMNGSNGFLCGARNGPMTITAVSVSGNTATYTVSGTLPWPIGSIHTLGAVANATPSTFNFSNGVVTATSTTTFTHTFGSSPGTWASGGFALDGIEADQATINDLVIAGNGSSTSAVGINIDSENCLQQTTIKNVFFTLLGFWVDGQVGNGTVRFEDITGGSFVSSGGGYGMLFGQFWAGPYSIINMETEGTTGSGSSNVLYAIFDDSGSGSQGLGGGGHHIEDSNFFAGNLDFVSPPRILVETTGATGTVTAAAGVRYCSLQNNLTWSGGGTAGC